MLKKYTNGMKTEISEAKKYKKIIRKYWKQIAYECKEKEITCMKKT